MKYFDTSDKPKFDTPYFNRFEVKCPYCHRVVSMIDSSKNESYHKDRSDYLEKVISGYRQMFREIDEWCWHHIGDTRIAEMFRELKSKYKSQGCE